MEPMKYVPTFLEHLSRDIYSVKNYFNLFTTVLGKVMRYGCVSGLNKRLLEGG